MTIRTTALLAVSVSVTPSKGYKGDSFNLSASWDSGGVGPFNVSINWGDGSYTNLSTTSKSISRSHVYSSTGNFTAKVSVDDEYTAASGSGSDSVEVRSSLSASLSSDKTTGDIPLTVNFICAMSGGYAPYNWSLTYGNGGSDSGQRSSEGEVFPGHTYTQVGTFTATLTVTDALGLSKIVKSTIKAGAIITQNIMQILLPTIVGLVFIKYAYKK